MKKSRQDPLSRMKEKREEEFWLGKEENDNSDLSEGEEEKHSQLEDWEKKYAKKFQKLYDEIPHKKTSFAENPLSCPGCFTVVCLNCEKDGKKFNKWKSKKATHVTVNPVTNEVTCRVCQAVIGQYIKDTYHFSEVIPPLDH